jgi:hypothetical protein
MRWEEIQGTKFEKEFAGMFTTDKRENAVKALREIGKFETVEEKINHLRKFVPAKHITPEVLNRMLKNAEFEREKDVTLLLALANRKRFDTKLIQEAAKHFNLDPNTIQRILGVSNMVLNTVFGKDFIRKIEEAQKTKLKIASLPEGDPKEALSFLRESFKSILWYDQKGFYDKLDSLNLDDSVVNQILHLREAVNEIDEEKLTGTDISSLKRRAETLHQWNFVEMLKLAGVGVLPKSVEDIWNSKKALDLTSEEMKRVVGESFYEDKLKKFEEESSSTE